MSGDNLITSAEAFPAPAERRGLESTPSDVALACQKGHKSPDTRQKTPWTHVQVWNKGVKIKRSSEYPQQFQGTSRGDVRGLSRKSRARLLWCVENTPEMNGEGLMFLTLTYPGEYPKDGREVKRHLDMLGKRARRINMCFLWSLEYQTRNAPHFHLLARFPPSWDIHQVREWLSQSWYDVVASGDEKHLYAGTSAEIVKNAGATGYYMAKYVGKWDQKKIPSDVTLPGRMWGLVGCKTPKPTVLSFKANDRDGIQLVRLVRRAEASAHSSRERRTILQRKRKRKLISKILCQHMKGDLSNSSFLVRMVTHKTKIYIPVWARRAWHPRDRGRDAGFSAHSSAAVVRQYLARTAK